MATKMKLPIIVLCILSVVLTIGFVTEKGRFSDEEISTFEFYSDEVFSLTEFETKKEDIITLEYDENFEVKTTLVNKNTYAPVVSTTKKAEEIILKEDTATAVNVDNLSESGYEMYFTENDIQMIARTIYGEAGSYWISRADKAKVAWTILNRVDSPRWSNTISTVITQPKQFYGYDANYPVTAECYEIAKDVLTRWSLEKQGVEIYREAAKNITAFYGDGRNNHFYVC